MQFGALPVDTMGTAHGSAAPTIHRSQHTDVFILIGLLIVFGSILGGSTMHHGKIAVLIQVSEFMIGGAELLQVLYELFQTARKEGRVGLESHIEDPAASEIFKKYPVFSKNHHAVPISQIPSRCF